MSLERDEVALPTLEYRVARLQEVNEQLLSGLLRAHEAEQEGLYLKSMADFARDMQQSLLPLARPIPGLEIHAALIPRDEVGGDFYDIVKRGRRATFVVGDVMGKGMPAALTMVMALTLFREATRVTMAPSRILRVVNQRLCKSLRHSITNNMVSAAVLTLDLTSRRVCVALAGQDGFLVYRAAERVADMALPPPGLPLGVDSGEVYRSMSTTVVPGDLLVLFTDGISEARSASGELFGKERLIDLLRQRTEKDLQTFGDGLVAEVRHFETSGHLRDDVVLVLIEITA